MPIINTLKSIQFTTVETLIEDLNSNFAIVQNSPLFKGIPGTEGLQGTAGPTGVRGSKFIFVDFNLFNTEFPGELNNLSDITLSFLNVKLLTYDNKIKLYSALNVDGLVDKDVIVLGNTLMLSYNNENNVFTNTGIAFNTDSGIISNIDNIIDTYLDNYLAPVVESLQNIFLKYDSLGKNYSDNDQSYVTTSLTSTSVYSPLIPNFSPPNGIPLNNHKYLGFNDVFVPLSMTSTTVFGSIKRYYQLLQNTIVTGTVDSISSDYSPGVNNIPSIVFLQDTYNNGIYFGYKNKPSLKNFGSIFKNSSNELVIKSDSGILPSEFSSLLIHSTYLKYNKNVFFGADLELTKDLTIFGLFKSNVINSGGFSSGVNINSIDIGNDYSNSITNFKSATIKFEDFVDKVLVTDTNSNLLNTYKIEKTVVTDTPNLDNLTTILSYPNNDKSVLTSNYFTFLANKINTIATFVNTNYWKKSDFIESPAVIPTLNLSTSFNFIDGLITGNKAGLIKTLNITATNEKNSSTNIRYTNFLNTVFVTSSNGTLLATYSIETGILNETELNNYNNLSLLDTPETDENFVLTSNYFNHLAKKINNLTTVLTPTSGDIWYKSDFNASPAVIPTLNLSSSLNVTGTTKLYGSGSLSSTILFSLISNVLTLGDDTSSVVLKSNNIKLPGFLAKILATNSIGNIVDVYSFESTTMPYTPGASNWNALIPETLLTSTTKVPKSSYLNWIFRKINTLITQGFGNVWFKDDWAPAVPVIPALKLTGLLNAGGNVKFGNSANPNFSTNGNATTIGSTASGNTLTLQGNIYLPYSNIIVTTDNNSKVVDTYSIESITLPQSTISTIESTYYTSAIYNSGNSDYTLSNWDSNYTNINSDTKIPTSKHWSWLFNNINIIRKLLYKRPTYNQMYKHLPIGTIVLWTNWNNSGVPEGWASCNGQTVTINGTDYVLPNLNTASNNDYVGIKGATSNHKELIGTNTKLISVDNLPQHSHSGTISGGAHKHDLLGTIGIVENTSGEPLITLNGDISSSNPSHALYANHESLTGLGSNNDAYIRVYQHARAVGAQKSNWDFLVDSANRPSSYVKVTAPVTSPIGGGFTTENASFNDLGLSFAGGNINGYSPLGQSSFNVVPKTMKLEYIMKIVNPNFPQ